MFRTLLGQTSSLYRMLRLSPDDGSGGGGAGNTPGHDQTGNRAAGDGNAPADDGNKQPAAKSFLDQHPDLWQDPVRKVDPVDPKLAEEAQARRNASLDNYVNAQNFVPQIAPEDITKMFDERNPQPIFDAINKAVQGALKRAILDTTRIVEGNNERQRAAMDDVARTRTQATESERSLFEAVPGAAKPAIRNVAMAIKAQLIKKGLDDAGANDGVKQYLKELAQSVAGDLDLDIAPRGEPGSGGGNRNGSRMRQNNVDTSIDWGAILRGNG